MHYIAENVQHTFQSQRKEMPKTAITIDHRLYRFTKKKLLLLEYYIETMSSAMSWSDHYLLRFGLCPVVPLCGETGPIGMVHPQRLLDHIGFQNALEGFLPDLVDTSVEAQVTNLYSKVSWPVEIIAPKCSLVSAEPETHHVCVEDNEASREMAREQMEENSLGM